MGSFRRELYRNVVQKARRLSAPGGAAPGSGGVAEVFARGLDCAACVAPRFLSDGDGKGGR